MEYTEKIKLWRFNCLTRFYGRAGTKNTPIESSVYLAGANGEAMVENKYLRSAGFFPNNWIGEYGSKTNHFHYGGGLNLRGYSGYFAVEQDDAGTPVLAYRGNSGFSVNTELEFDGIIKIKKLPKLRRMFDFDSYVFADMGAINFVNSNNKTEWSTLRADLGVGASITIKQWFKLYDIKPLTFRFDVPFFLSTAPAGENNVAFRWVVGVNRAF
jgi:aminopeptidase N